MTSTKIKIETGVKYLSESTVLKQLPTNCLFSKGKTGCGGTYLALTNKHPYVIAVPFVSLIQNKVSQHSNILGVYEGVTDSDIKNYIDNTETPIIMVTYDSLKTVTNLINPSDYKLLVDEYHLLFTQYSFRKEAIHSVLDNYKKYKEYCFMTATPLEEEFILEELKGLKTVELEWANTVEVQVKSILCPSGVINSTVELVNSFLNGEEDGNLYLFVNSVNFIKDIINNTDVDNSNCNVIYSKNNKTDIGLDRGVLPCKLDGSIKPKKINLLTSTVFEGTDIYDVDGKTYIISDATKAHSLIDISTSFQQIAGRIRNSKYINEITHLYTNTRYNHLSYEEFKLFSEKTIEESKTTVNEINTLSETSKAKITIQPNESYISKINNEFVFNPNLVKLDLYNFKVCKHLYKIKVNALDSELSKYGYTNTKYQHISSIKISPKDLESFQTVVETLEGYSKRLCTDLEVQDAYTEAAFIKYPFLKDAINKLGFDGIKKENYIQTNVKRKLTSMLTCNNETKIFKLLKQYSDISAGEFISASVLKERFKKIYSDLGITTTAKGSDIEKFFNTKTIKKRLNNKVVSGYILINPKILINLNK